MAQGWQNYPPVEATNGVATSPETAGCGAFSSDLPPAVVKVPGKRLRIETGAAARRQMVKVYRQMASGELDVTKGSKLIYALTEISRQIEREAVEALSERLDRVERR